MGISASFPSDIMFVQTFLLLESKGAWLCCNKSEMNYSLEVLTCAAYTVYICVYTVNPILITGQNPGLCNSKENGKIQKNLLLLVAAMNKSC